jgi:hypothetical protein
MTPLGAWVACLSLACTFVGTLYVMDSGIAARDHPATIKYLPCPTAGPATSAAGAAAASWRSRERARLQQHHPHVVLIARVRHDALAHVPAVSICRHRCRHRCRRGAL